MRVHSYAVTHPTLALPIEGRESRGGCRDIAEGTAR